tara:strand:+ start:317 stop:631 length:315 start_codon:yes stop_codon:yes gene_type:complete
MGIRVVKRVKKKPNPDRKKTKKVRKKITTSNFNPNDVTKSGKFTSMSNADVKRRSTKKVVKGGFMVGEGHTNTALGKKYANRDLARMNRASGEAARNARKRTRY